MTATINPDPGEEVVRNYAPIRSAMWNDYTVSADVGGFAIPGDDSMAGISVLKPPDGGGEFPGRVDVTIHDNGYSVNVQGLVMIPPVPLFEAPEHHVVISVTDVQVIVTVDDAEPTVIDIPPHAVRNDWRRHGPVRLSPGGHQPATDFQQRDRQLDEEMMMRRLVAIGAALCVCRLCARHGARPRDRRHLRRAGRPDHYRGSAGPPGEPGR